MNKLHIRGCDQGSSSVDFRLKPRSNVPTVPTSVEDPRKSIRCTLSYMVRFRTSSGNRMFTFQITRMVDNAKTGICEKFFEFRHKCFLQKGKHAAGGKLPGPGRQIACQYAQSAELVRTKDLRLTSRMYHSTNRLMGHRALHVRAM